MGEARRRNAQANPGQGGQQWNELTVLVSREEEKNAKLLYDTYRAGLVDESGVALVESQAPTFSEFLRLIIRNGLIATVAMVQAEAKRREEAVATETGTEPIVEVVTEDVAAPAEGVTA